MESSQQTQLSSCSIAASAFAHVLKEPVLDPQRFGETVALNRGMNVRTFDNLEDALAWLRTTLTNRPDAGDG